MLPNMKWIAIAGGWRRTNLEIEEKVREEVREILSNGDGIISGGALGVDYLATDEALKMDVDKNQLKIFIPTTLDIYKRHYDTMATDGAVTKEQAFYN
jgi:predicted Rossmann fold nucleotide-binding protein DprA/Smf involved in DNA uptake